ncbi:MAG: hypothetical protein ILP11_03520 [Alphaproteobacteria bacterium]|nr:hypothetical protein [Alphaproteobacteria bacterium]
MIQSKHQKGSMMIEVVAVVALLALLTPLLFRQIQRRTDEVDNVRIASVMREAKDIVQRAIEDNVDGLIEAFKGKTGTNECLNKNTWPATTSGRKLADYVPAYYTSGTTKGFPKGVNYFICRHLVNNQTDRPVFFGIVVDGADGFEQSFLPAADIATMIGAEGGVCGGEPDDDGISHEATGVREGWHLHGFSNFSCSAELNEIVALTSLVGASPIGTIDAASLADFITKDGSVRAAFVYGEDMHAEGFTAGSSTDRVCITDPFNNIGTRTEEDDDNCVPVFEVVSYENDAKPGEVYIRNAKLIFDPETTDTYVRPTDETNVPSQENIRNDTNRATDPLDGKSVEYAIDPTSTSVMKDIRLIDRGNALLSDLLPNYILKGVMVSTVDAGVETDRGESLSGWTCPPNHKKAVIVEGCTLGTLSQTGGTFRCTGGTGTGYTFRVYKYCVFKNN